MTQPWRVHGADTSTPKVPRQAAVETTMWTLDRGSNTDKESKHTVSVCSLFLFVIGRIPTQCTFTTIGRSARIMEHMAARRSRSEQIQLSCNHGHDHVMWC